MTTPHVSVVMSVFNGERFLAEAVESILHQTFSDFEFIIINDGSSDKSADILSKYEHLDERVHIYHQENRGLIASLNRGLDFVRGKYLARMDADDVSLPYRLAEQVSILEQRPELVILGSAYEVIDGCGKSTGVVRPPSQDTAIRWEMLFQCAFAHSSVMLRLDGLRQQRLAYDDNALYAEDYELWSRLLVQGQGMNYSKPLIKRRLHDQRVGKVFAAQQKENADKVSRRNLANLGIELSGPDVRILRQWYSRFPAKLNPREIALCSCWLEILERFSSQPVIEASVWRPIRGRWIVRIMLARSRNFPTWKLSLLKYLSLKDIFAVLAYMIWHWRLARGYLTN